MSELAQAIEEMRNMRESYDQLSEAAVAYNEGKPALAEAITAKGVEAASTDSLATMAEKVMTISQDTYEIDGGEMYAKQLFGVANNDIVPGYWNLYDIMAQLLSDGRLVNYGGILLAEYYKGYDSLALSGAGAGGAYVVSDKDANGDFIMYTEDTTHTWATEDDGKGNRWVAYCFADAGHDFEITDTNTSPRTIHIGRKVGSIRLLANSRISEMIVSDGNSVLNIETGTYTQKYGQKLVVRNIKNQSGCIIYLPSSGTSNVEAAYIEADEISGVLLKSVGYTQFSMASLIINCKKWSSGWETGAAIMGAGRMPNLKSLIISGAEEGKIKFAYNTLGDFSALKNLTIVNDDSQGVYYDSNQKIASNCIIYLGYKNNTGNFVFSSYTQNAWSNVKDLMLQDGWCKGLDAHLLSSLTEANMCAHILQRLKQDEADCGDGVTITLGATNLAKLTSQESIDLLDSLTNTYGYTFA